MSLSFFVKEIKKYNEVKKSRAIARGSEKRTKISQSTHFAKATGRTSFTIQPQTIKVIYMCKKLKISLLKTYVNVVRFNQRIVLYWVENSK